MAGQLVTERLTLRPWQLDDAEQALGIYGDAEVVRWLSPAMSSVADLPGMRQILRQWVADSARLEPPAGRWAIELSADGSLVGGAVLLPLPPRGDDLEMGWQLHPKAWGHGYAAEAGRAIARWAFAEGFDEVLAVARLANIRAAATARRIGMEWVGETDKYYGLRLQVFRLRPGDLDVPPRG